jgi:hypothetical protein
MVRVRTITRRWKNELIKKALRWEKCPNPDCNAPELNYPTYMINPKCPDCETTLLGAGLCILLADRISFHLEV